MRRGRAIAFATALEILGEPLCMLVTLTALALAALAPSVHYHQFGEPTRMARDAGFSALVLGGMLFAAFGAVKTFRREVESGTMQTALAHSVSRSAFFLWKFVGCSLAYLVFSLTVGAVSLIVVNGAEIGGRVAAPMGDIARIWGPSLALALSPVIVGIGFAALRNRFARARFTLTAELTALIVALAGTLYRFDASLFLRIVPAAVLFAMPPLVLMSAASAFAVRFRTNVAASLSVLAFALMLPALGNYCLSDALAKGGSVPGGYFWAAVCAAVPALAAFLALGVHFINGKDAA